MILRVLDGDCMNGGCQPFERKNPGVETGTGQENKFNFWHVECEGLKISWRYEPKNGEWFEIKPWEGIKSEHQSKKNEKMKEL